MKSLSMKNKKNINFKSFQRKVSCNGGEGDLGHPRIYLIISSKKDSVSCPYCGKLFEKSN